jgi:ATP-dependent 26S proteasome regulatory subunit
MPQSLDKALTRPGRFDKKITLPYPSQKDRVRLFDYYLQRLKGLDPDLNVDSLGRMMVRKTGADIKNLVNQAGLLSVGRDSDYVQMQGVSLSCCNS